jgi:hypothetical protein
MEVNKATLNLCIIILFVISVSTAGAILSIGLASSGIAYKFINREQSLCEPAAIPVSITVPITTDKKQRVQLLHKLKKDIARLLKFLKKSLDYLQRLTIYFLYGVPLTGLVRFTKTICSLMVN